MSMHTGLGARGKIERESDKSDSRACKGAWWREDVVATCALDSLSGMSRN